MVLRIGLVGCGRIAGFFHLPVLASLPGVELVAIADSDPARLSEAARRAAQAERFLSYEELLRDAPVDAVVLCLPPAQHADAAVAAFRLRKHVYLEKPLALSLEDGSRVVRAWRDARTVGMMGFNFRFNPAYLDLRRRISDGEIGDVVAARATFCSARRVLPDWKRTADGGGGALRDLGAHILDLLPHMFGSPIETVAALQRSQITEADTALLNVELASGLPIQVLLSLSTGINTNRLEVFGTTGRLVADAGQARPDPVERAEGRFARAARIGRALGGLDPRRLLRSPGTEPSFAAALTAFVHAARENGPVQPDIADGYRCLSAVVAAETAPADRPQPSQLPPLSADPVA